MARTSRGEAFHGVQSFLELRERLGQCRDAEWRAMATDARWKHVLAGVKMGGFEDGDLALLLREAERLGGRLLVEGLPAQTPLMAKAAMTELVDVLFEAGMCSLDASAGAKELAAEPTARQEPWRGRAAEQADAGWSHGGVGEALQEVAELLRGDTFESVFKALEIVDACRHELRPGTLAEAARMDRLEAEGLRWYAQHQAEAERYGFAIDGYLEKAIKLDPRRAELYADRARFRLQQACPWLPQDGEFPSEAARAEAMRALDDCNFALSLDASLADAYELQLPVLLAMGDLALAERLVTRGEAAVAHAGRAADLGRGRRYAGALRRGLERAEAMLDAAERQPSEVESQNLGRKTVRSPAPMPPWPASALPRSPWRPRSCCNPALRSHGCVLKAAASLHSQLQVERLLASLREEAGPRLEPPLRRRLEALLQRARMQRDFEEAYDDKAAKTMFDSSWAQLFDPRRASGSKAQSSGAAPGHRPSPQAPEARGERSGHGWGRKRTQAGEEEGRPDERKEELAEFRSKAGARSPPGRREAPRRSSSDGEAPRRSSNGGDEFHVIIAGLQRCLEGLHGRDRQHVLRQLFLEWHPDKRPHEQELATKVFQWLQDIKDA